MQRGGGGFRGPWFGRRGGCAGRSRRLYRGAGGGYDESIIDGRLGAPWAFSDPGMWIKPHPSGALTHPALAATGDLLREEDIRSDEVAAIRVRTNDRIRKILASELPTTGLQAKFNMEFCVAILILDGRAGLSEFTDQVVSRPDVMAMMDRIDYGGYSDPEPGFTNVTTLIEIDLSDGRTLSGWADYARGSTNAPMSFDDVTEKFRGCVSHADWPDDKAAQIIEFVGNLDTHPSLAGLVGALTRLRADSGAAIESSAEPPQNRPEDRGRYQGRGREMTGDFRRKLGAEFFRMRRADNVRRGQDDNSQYDPGYSLAEHHEREAQRRGRRRRQPPSLTGGQFGGHAARRFGRQAQTGPQGKHGKSGQAPKNAFSSVDLSATQGEARNQDKPEPDRKDYISERRIGGPLDTVARSPSFFGFRRLFDGRLRGGVMVRCARIFIFLGVQNDGRGGEFLHHGNDKPGNQSGHDGRHHNSSKHIIVYILVAGKRESVARVVNRVMHNFRIAKCRAVYQEYAEQHGKCRRRNDRRPGLRGRNCLRRGVIHLFGSPML